MGRLKALQRPVLWFAGGEWVTPCRPVAADNLPLWPGLGRNRSRLLSNKKIF